MARGHQGVYILRGGLDEWRDQVLTPVLASDPSPFEAGRNKRLQARAAHFGGQARVSAGAAPEPVAAAPVPLAAAPGLAPPPAPASGAAPIAKKKKKEGC